MATGTMSRVVPGTRKVDLVDALIRLVEEYIEKHRLLPVRRLVAGVSGGADSMALLFVLKDICDRKYPDIPIVCAHVNHGIREEAGRDEKVVEDFCRSLSVPFQVSHADIPKMAEEEGLSLETAGRIARYAFFRETAGEDGTIAVAHHMEDQAESVAMHIFRGCGMEGLCGIRPKNGNIIHPFLCLHKEEILRFCEEKKIPYCHDITNDDPSYDRNFWRKEVLPLIRKGTDRNPVTALNGLSERVSEENDYLDDLAEAALENAMREKNCGDTPAAMRDDSRDAAPAAMGEKDRDAAPAAMRGEELSVPVAALAEMARPLRRRALRILAIRTWGDVVDMEECHWDAVLKLAEKAEGTGHLDLPDGRKAERERGCIRFLPGASAFPEGGYVEGVGFLVPEGSLGEEIRISQLPLGEKVNFSQRFGQIRLRRIVKGEPLIYNNLTWFFPESALDGAVIRTRRTGDSFSRAGSGCTKQLRRYMTELGIPPRFRDRMVLAAREDQVLWIPGLAHAEGFTDELSGERFREARPKEDGESLYCLEIFPTDNGK